MNSSNFEKINSKYGLEYRKVAEFFLIYNMAIFDGKKYGYF